MAYIKLPSFPTRCRYRHPPLLPSPSLTHPYKQTAKGHPCQSRSGYAVGARSATLFFWERPSQKYIRWAFTTPAQNTYVGAPSLPYPTNSLTLRSPKPNYGQLTSKGPTLGGCFLHHPFWAHGQVNLNPKKLGGGILGTPHFGPLVATCPFFGLLSITDHLDQLHTYRYPTYRRETHLSWGKPKLNSFFSFAISHTGGNLH